MTDKQHPFTPPAELQEEWLGLWPQDALLQAARWGADQELEACCEWLVRNYNYPKADNPLRAARRPKPKGLAEEALEAMSRMWEGSPAVGDWDLIRLALKRLQKLEGQTND